MRHRWLGLTGAALLAWAALGGCGRPSEEKCKKAVENIRVLTGTDRTGAGPDQYAAVRSCRSQASRDAVDCMIAAKTREDLMKCEGGLADEVSGGPAQPGK